MPITPEDKEYARRLDAVADAYRDDPEEMGQQIIEEMLRMNRERPSHERLSWQTKWTIGKYKAIHKYYFGVPVSKIPLVRELPWFRPEREPEPFEVITFDGNLALNEGITEVMDLITGAAATAYSAANTYLGVGADSTAAVATQTGLQAPSNKVYVLVDSVAKSGQTITWQATFGSGVANFAWEEFTIANGSSDTADNLNRKVSAQGTKASPNIWILQCKITLG